MQADVHFPFTAPATFGCNFQQFLLFFLSAFLFHYLAIILPRNAETDMYCEFPAFWPEYELPPHSFPLRLARHAKSVSSNAKYERKVGSGKGWLGSKGDAKCKRGRRGSLYLKT